MKIRRYVYRGFALLALIVAGAKLVSAQNVGISSSNSFTPDGSAALDVSFTNRGLLIPRVALTANNAAGPISAPAVSLLVYNTATAGTSPNNVTPGYYYWNGSVWVMLSTSTPSSGYWSTTGNAGTTSTGTSSTLNFLGTTDNVPFRMRTYNTQRMILDTLGNVGIGSNPIFSNSMEKLLVDAGTTSSYNVISGKGSLNNYLQLNIQNISNGASASSDVVATNDQGTEANGINFIDMGVNSSAYNLNTYPILNGVNNTYLYSTGNDMLLGNATAAKNLIFFTGGTALTNERMRIDGTGNVGIGTTSPTQKLDVNGSINAATSVISQGSVITDAALSNTGSALPGLQFGGGSSGESISSKRTSGTNQYGIDFYTSSNNRMTITNAGNLGINITQPTSTLAVNGSIAVVANTTTRSTPPTLGASDYIIINTSNSNTPTYTLPSAGDSRGRMYRIVNQGGNPITIAFANTNNSVIGANGSTITSVGTAAGSNVLEVVSDGTTWRKINN